MGTRNVTAVIQDGKYKVAQYGQWDGYPSGQGADIRNILASKKNRERLRKAIAKVRFTNDRDNAQEDIFLKSIGVTNGWMNMEQADVWKEHYPLYSRDIGGQILQMIIDRENEKEIVLRECEDLFEDNIWIEYSYVVNLDDNTLTAYSGAINKGNLIKSYNLDRLPGQAKFVNELNKLVGNDY